MPKFTQAASRAYIPSSSFLSTGVVASSEPVAPVSNNSARCATAYSQGTSSPHSQSGTLGRSKHKVIPTKRALAGHIPEVAKSKQRSRAYKRTLELKKVGSSSRGRKLEYTTRTQSQLDDDQTDSEPEISTCDRTAQPPTPISTSAKEKAPQISKRRKIESQIFRKFRQILQDSETQALEGVLGDLSNNSTDSLRTEESDPEVRVLSPVPVAVGGGFHLDYHSTNFKEMSAPVSSSLARPMPSRPLADPASPFINRTGTLNPPQPPKAVGNIPSPPVSPAFNNEVGAVHDHMSEGGETEIEVTDQPMTEWGIPTSSQSLGGLASDRLGSAHPTLPRPTSAQSNHSEPIQVEDQMEAQVEDQQEAQAEDQQETQVESQQSQGKTLGVPPLRQSNVRTSAPVAITRPSTRTAASRSGPYRTRLNIVAINSSRGLTQTPWTTVNSMTQRRSSQPNPTPNPTPAPRSSSQHRPLRNQSAQAPSLPFESPPASQAQYDTNLLEDDEEARAILRAMATCTNARCKKRKPAMSDLDGEERHIVLIVRDLVLARSLQEGAFQTRGVYRRWFEESYAQVYSLVYDGEFAPASDDMCTITINNMSTSRGHIHEREREVVRRYYDFVDPTNDEQCQDNVNSYAILWPTAFLCKDPSNETGYFESNVIGAGIAAGYFHSPTAVGVKYPKYFKSMDYPLIAFILCSIQCCISEWEEGYFEKKPLSARYMLSLYVCHLKGLKEAEVKAPGRMAELRAKWYDDSLNASGALRTAKSKKFVQRIIRREDIRPDSPHRRQRPVPRNATPGPGPTSESNRTLRLSPLGPRSSATPSPPSRLQSPLSPRAEGSFDTSQAKGKGRAN